jgi:hypothetical protein
MKIKVAWQRMHDQIPNENFIIKLVTIMFPENVEKSHKHK